MEMLLIGLSQILEPHMLMAIAVASIGGLAIGAIPGIGPTIAIVILLPISLFLDELVFFVLMLGVYGSSLYGSALPAIITNAPRAPANALTNYAGYANTHRREVNQALGITYAAAFFGGCFTVALALICFSLVIVAHRQTMSIAALLFGVGFLIAMVGHQPIHDVERYTFGIEYLYPGFNVVVVIVGLLAVSQALVLLSGKNAPASSVRMNGALLPGFIAIWRSKVVALRSAASGALMGVIPGAGNFITQHCSDSSSSYRSKKPTRFGHGSSEGLIAGETAKHAVPVAAMIPLLVLGVPGEALTAIVAVVFFESGIKPGPDIFHLHSDFVFALLFALFLIHVLVVITLLVGTRLFLKLLSIPNHIAGTFLMMISVAGVYSIQNSITDCLFAVGFGYFGYILRRLDWPLMPALLGLVLGSVMLKKLAAGASEIGTVADLVNRPVAGTLFVVILMVIVFCVVVALRREKVIPS